MLRISRDLAEIRARIRRDARAGQHSLIAAGQHSGALRHVATPRARPPSGTCQIRKVAIFAECDGAAAVPGELQRAMRAQILILLVASPCYRYASAYRAAEDAKLRKEWEPSSERCRLHVASHPRQPELLL